MDSDRKKSRQFSFLNIMHQAGNRSAEKDKRTLPSPPLYSPDLSPSYPSNTVPGVNGPLSDASIHADFLDLYTSIIHHVDNYYSSDANIRPASQEEIELATAGLFLPWASVRVLLHDSRQRRGILVLCIAWATLSRCLLLKLGMSNSPGSSFLPPEIVECFQSFSLVKGLKQTDHSGLCQAELALLSRWKQITATLSHSTYVTNGFSFFDPRIINLERALRDLAPLLKVYASASKALDSTRLSDLREVAKKGSRLAFSLFAQPSFWKFDWSPPVSWPITCRSQDDINVADRGTADWKHTEATGKKEDHNPTSSLASVASSTLDASVIVIWPALLRVVDSEGVRVAEDGKEVTEKVTLGCFTLEV